MLKYSLSVFNIYYMCIYDLNCTFSSTLTHDTRIYYLTWIPLRNDLVSALILNVRICCLENIMQPEDFGMSNWTNVQFFSILSKRSFLTLHSNLILNQYNISDKMSGRSTYFWNFAKSAFLSIIEIWP